LKNQKDINSTEKLLNVIRGKKDEVRAEKEEITILSKKPSFSSGRKFLKFFPERKIYNVGVDISSDYIYLAKAAPASDGRYLLVDQKSINYGSKMAKGSFEFTSLLKSVLISFCGNPAKCNIWTMITAEEVNVYHLKIPRVQKKQLENAILWSAKKDISVDEKDVIFDYELQGDIIDQGIPKYSVLAYSAPKAEIEKNKAMFSNIGITLAGITIAPFAIQNIFRSKWLPLGERTIATLFIGNQFSRIDIYRKENLALTRGVKTGTSSMMEAIKEAVVEKTQKNRLKEEEAREILFSLGADEKKPAQIEADFGLNEQDIFKMIIPAVERLVRQIERTLEYYATSLGQEKIEEIFISSTMSAYPPMLNYISEQLGINCVIFDPFKYQIAEHIAESIPISDRMAVIPALGLSLSDQQRTPNLIFNYQEKNKEVRIKIFNRVIFAATAFIVALCIIIIIYQGMQINVLTSQKSRFSKELSLFQPLISEETVTKLAAEVKRQRHITGQYAERYLGMAVIGEVSELTPENIRLIKLQIITARNPMGKEKTGKTAKDVADGVTLEGIINGERNMLDLYLTQYMMKLGNSPLLTQVLVNKSNIVNFKRSDVLQFTITAKVGRQS